MTTRDTRGEDMSRKLRPLAALPWSPCDLDVRGHRREDDVTRTIAVQSAIVTVGLEIGT